MSLAKKILVIVALVAFSSVLVSASGESRHLVMNGTLNGKIAIHMDITITGGSVTGTYYYVKQKKPITLSGTYSAEEKTIKLTETDQGKITGYFDGTVTAANGITIGTWSNATKTKSFTFELHEETPASTVGWPSHGIYKIDNGELDIGAIAQGSFGFNIEVATAQSVGGVDGRATVNGQRAEFNDPENDCKLVFTPIPGGIKVDPTGCSSFGGVGVWFGGNYRRQK